MFIEKLQEELEKRNLSLNKLSKELNFSQAATSRWKHGSYPSIDILANICKYLNVSADYLLELEPKPPDRLTPDEEFLIECYRMADPPGKELIKQIVQREASRGQPPDEGKESSISKIG